MLAALVAVIPCQPCQASPAMGSCRPVGLDLPEIEECLQCLDSTQAFKD